MGFLNAIQKLKEVFFPKRKVNQTPERAMRNNFAEILDAARRERNGEKGAIATVLNNQKPVPKRKDVSGRETLGYVEGDGERDRVAPGSVSVPSPRPWHYFCAHRFLPDNLSSMGYGFVRIMMKEQLSYLERHWATQAVKVGFQHPYIDGDGLATFPFKFSDGRYGIVIRMPPPAAMAEAFFVAIVAYPDESRAPRYLTLELTGTGAGSTATVFCEWSGGGHFNFGAGCRPTVNAFISSVEEKTR